MPATRPDHILDLLFREHDTIHSGLYLLDQAASMLDAGKPVPEGFPHWVIEFLRDFADHCHHATEEGVLFPALVRKSGGALDGAIAALVQEHVDFKGYIATLDRLDLDSAADRIEFAQVAHRYVEELRQHIFRENREVYAAARQLFTDDELFGLLSDADATGRADSMQGCGERHAASLMQWQARFFAAAKIKTDDPAVG